MEIGAYGKNILNEQYIIDAGNSGNTIGFPTFVAGNPTVFGAQLKIGF
jgi:outer membrane receptor protein involved in Fe transport